MSTRWPGGIISGTAPVPTGGGVQDSAPGVWTLEQADQYIATNEWPGTGIPDPQFQYVTALLHGDGFAGGQNNIFLDSSPNNFFITRYGNTTQGSFSPYGNLWSNFFPGSSNLNFTAASIGSSTDFTLELWVAPTTSISGGNFGLFAQSDGRRGIITVSGNLYWLASSDISTSAPLVVGAWNHVAVTRSGTTLRIFLNGSLVASGSNSDAFSGNWRIASNQSNERFPNGYFSNCRIVSGTALYTSNFTPSTTPLTAVSGTQVLTCQANRFIDASSNNVSITLTGTPSVQRFSPFQNLATYTPARVGGSGYVDGSGDYIETPSNAAFNLPGNFTVDLWVYFTGNPFGGGASREIFASTVNGGLAFLITGTQLIVARTGIANDLTGNFTTVANTWYHFAISRSSNNMSIYANGVRVANGTISTDYSTGGFYTTAGTQGFLSDWRIVKGTALYDPSQSTLTVPTAPLTAVSGTSLLCNFTNASIFDSDASVDFETVGNAQISTSVVKYGTGSMAFDGSGDYLVPSSPGNNQNFVFGTSNFTIEFWVYFNSGLGSDIVLYDSRPLSTNGVYPTIYVNSSSQLAYVVSTADRIVSGIAFVTGIWYHVAVSRAGSSTRMFINGNQVGSTYTDTNSYLNPVRRPVIAINGFNETAAPLNGYIDDFRITNGYARYWYNFQPPTRAFPNYGGTVIEMEDPLFEYNALLLNGDGANGGQNNTFLDSSTNNFTITRNGNTTQGSFSPYGTLWSNFFNGTNAYLTAPDNAAFTIHTGNWTIEAWIYPTSVTGYQTVITRRNAIWEIGLEDAKFYWYNGTVYSTTATVIRNTWNHVAATWDGTSVRLYINGLLARTISGANAGSGTGSVAIGAVPVQYFNGNIVDLRVVKGTALYTGNTYTIPTAPLTAISGTSLLTCQSNRFVDNSSNNFTLTVNGTPSVQRFSPYEPSAPYSTSVIGGSGYFDGSGDNLSIADSSAWNVGSGDFTAEAWIYPQSFANEAMIMGQWSGDLGGTGLNWALMLSSGSTGYLRLITSSNGSSVLFDLSTSTFALTLNAWQHIAAVRNGNTYTIYVNGVSRATTTNSSALYDANNSFTIGAESNSPTQYFNGYICDARFVKSAVYTTGFTPPTAPLTAITNTQLLTNFTNAAIPDYAMQNDLETVGNAQISNSVVKYGSGSIAFDGNGDGLSFAPLSLGSGDLTVEWWANQSSALPYFSGDGVYAGEIFSGNTTGALGIFMYSGSASGAATNIWVYVYAVGTVFQPAISISLNQWNHFALTRASGTWRLFVNGNQVGTSTTSGTYNLVNNRYIGWRNENNFFDWFPGYIDDFRVTRGIARYVQPFTPPTAALPTF